MRKHLFTGLLAIALCLSLSVPVFAEEGQTVHASVQRTDIVIDGTAGTGLLCGPGEECEPITYNGTVYIPLYTAGLWLGADVAYDQSIEAVFIVSNGAEPVYYSHFDLDHMGAKWQLGNEQMRNDQKNGVYVQLMPDVTVTVNGQLANMVNALGGPVYPLLFRESIYLPVRSVAGWMGKQVQWTGNAASGAVYIYAAPTQETVAEANAYIAAVRERTDAVRALLERAEVHTEEEFTANMRAIQAHLKALMELPPPEFSSLADQMRFVPYNTTEILMEKVDGYLPEGEKSGAEEFWTRLVAPIPVAPLTWPPEKEFFELTPEKKWEYIGDIFLTETELSNPWFLTMEKQCGFSETFMAAVTAAQPTV